MSLPTEQASSGKDGTRFERVLFAAFLFLVPFQARLFLVDFGEGLSSGEWTQAWLWASDLVFIALLFFWARRDLRLRHFTPLLFLLVFLPSLLAHPTALSFWSVLKVAEGFLLFAYVRRHREWVFSSPRLLVAFLAGVTLNALIGVGQFAFQRDLGLQLLGESPLSPHLSGVAKFSLAGESVMRAYGFTPHPNILASFLLAGVVAVFFLSVVRGMARTKRTNSATAPYRNGLLFAEGALLPLFLAGLLVTFSRTAWFAAVFVLLGLLGVIVLRRVFRKAYLVPVLRSLFIIIAIGVILLTASQSFVRARSVSTLAAQEVTLRVFYAQQAFDMIGENPIVGVGPGQFVSALALREPEIPAWQVQPVHNVWLLVAAEYGMPVAALLAIALTLLFLVACLRVTAHQNPQRKLASICVLALTVGLVLFSLSDHFLWTSQQGRMLLWLTLGLLAA